MTVRAYSLTQRVLLWGLSIGLIVSILSAALLFFITYEEARDNQDDQLEEVVGLLARVDVSSRHPDALWMDDDAFEDWFIVDDESEDSVAEAGSTVLVRTLHGGGRAMRVSFDRDLVDGAQTVSISGTDYRLVMSTLSRGTHIAVAQRSDEIRDAAVAAALSAVIPLLLLTVILFATLGAVFWISTRPVARLAASLYARSPDDTTPVTAEALPAEILPLINAFNDVLAKIDQLRKRESRFTADAAHELRSPLAALSLQAERLEKKVKDEETLHDVRALRQSIDRASHLVSQLLSLKRAQAKVTSPTELSCPAQALTEILSEAIEGVLAEADRKKIELSAAGFEMTDVKDAPAIAVNRDDLFTILRNLLENAVRYSDENARVTVTLESLTPFAMRVSDTGPSIAPENRERVFDPFYRALGTKATGTGLGLAIVKTLAQQNALDIELSDTEPDAETSKGLTVRIVQKRR